MADERLTGQRRRRWIQRLMARCREYWPDLAPDVSARLARRALVRSGGRVLRGMIRDGRTSRPVCIKWCPDADPAAMEQTLARGKWWRRYHPGLSRKVPDPVAFWPDEMVLLMEWRDGKSLGRCLPHGFGRAGKRASVLDDCAATLGRWFREFAEGHSAYGVEVEPLLGLHARQKTDGSLVVDARHLLEQRIERGEQAAHALYRSGVITERSWSDRFACDDIISSLSDEEPAGFIHGDLKPDNVLVHEGHISVIDWWTTPRVSWPLTDVGTFHGNLRLHGGHPTADRLWARFASCYYSDGLDERTERCIELVSTILCLTVMAGRLRHPLVRRMARPLTCRQFPRRLPGSARPVAAP